MSNVPSPYASSAVDAESEETWIEYVHLLRRNVRHFVHSANVVRWRYQREDLIKDIVQETALRFIERYQRAERGELSPLGSPRYVIIKIARNHCIDMWRKDRRLQGSFPDGDVVDDTSSTIDDQKSFLDIAVENVYLEKLFAHLAHEVASFPFKQREALLVDLANRMHFDTELTPLQSAFQSEGMNLHAYQRPLSSDSVVRARHNALVSLAYKRVATCMRKYVVEIAEEE
jgi:DNA-directed RNA polymerase specialized sigma24 family protein